MYYIYGCVFPQVAAGSGRTVSFVPLDTTALYPDSGHHIVVASYPLEIRFPASAFEAEIESDFLTSQFGLVLRRTGNVGDGTETSSLRSRQAKREFAPGEMRQPNIYGTQVSIEPCVCSIAVHLCSHLLTC